MFCDNCEFYQTEKVNWLGLLNHVELCQASEDDICPATLAQEQEQEQEHEGDTARDKALNVGLHPTEIDPVCIECETLSTNKVDKYCYPCGLEVADCGNLERLYHTADNQWDCCG